MEDNEGRTDIPELTFKGLSLKHDVAGLRVTWEERRLWSKHCGQYPRFRAIKSWNKQQIEKELKETYWDERLDIFIASSQERYSLWWKEVDEYCYEVMEHVFDLKMEQGTVFSAFMGISPVFPRFIKDKSFLVPFFTERKNILKVCIHEISHFYFYEKGERMGIETEMEDFWLASEILAPVMLTEKRIIDLIGRTVRETYACSDRKVLDEVERSYRSRISGQITSEEMMLNLLDTASESSIKS